MNAASFDASRRRLQRIFEKLERRTSLQLLRVQAELRACEAERSAVFERTRSARSGLFSQPQLTALGCSALWAYTARSAAMAAHLNGQRTRLSDTTRKIIADRMHWMCCRIGLERRALRHKSVSC